MADMWYVNMKNSAMFEGLYQGFATDGPWACLQHFEVKLNDIMKKENLKIIGRQCVPHQKPPTKKEFWSWFNISEQICENLQIIWIFLIKIGSFQ